MSKLSMIGQMKKEAERDFTKFVKYVAELEEENRKLKAELEIYKKQYKHTIGGDYIDEDLYDLDC